MFIYIYLLITAFPDINPRIFDKLLHQVYLEHPDQTDLVALLDLK
jgi:hypothetical protein